MRQGHGSFVAALLLAGLVTPAAATAQMSPPAVGEPEPLSVLQGRPDAQGAELVGAERFESRTAGIALDVPIGMTEVRTAGPDEVARFADEQTRRTLSVSQITPRQPMPLALDLPIATGFGGDNDGGDADGAGAGPSPAAAEAGTGMLELMADQVLEADQSAVVLRQDVATVGGRPVGLLATGHTRAMRRWVSHRALVPASDQLYYKIELTTPLQDAGVPEVPEAGADADAGVDVDADLPTADADAPFDAAARIAGETMTAVLESVELIDRSDLKDEQDQRLLWSMGWLADLDAGRIADALADEQWLRIQRNGRDVGFSHVVERTEMRGGRDGVLIQAMTRTYRGGGGNEDGANAADSSPDGSTDEARAAAVLHQVSETSLWSSSDREHELWSSLVQTSAGADGVTSASEIGQSDTHTRYVKDDRRALGDLYDPANPPMRTVKGQVVKVRNMARQRGGDWVPVGEPVERSAPPWYLPQALWHLLPRLVPADEPGAYLFASYVPERRELMMRYVDVGEPQQVTLGGREVRAVPVRDRVGYEGAVTTHWVSPDDRTYLGSTNEASGITILTTDTETLRELWPDAAEAGVLR